MPEGDTIFRAARTLDRALRGHPVARFETRYAQLARVDDDAPIAGRMVEAVWSQGKHLLMRFSGDLVLRTHLRMNGSWHLYRPGERWQRPRQAMRIVVATAGLEAVAFDVPVAELLDADAFRRSRELRRLGPDLLATDFDAGAALARLRSRPEATAGEALLDQSLMAGAGNVFKCEILFLCGIHPARRIGELADADLAAMVATARRLLAANVQSTSGDGIVTYFGMRRTTRRSDPAESLWVYGRGGRPCRRCGTSIAVFKQGLDARLTFHCPRCQPV